MHFRNLLLSSLAALAITACGASTASTPPVTLVPSAGALLPVASPVPVGTVTPAAPAGLQTADPPTVQPPGILATPTPLATAPSATVVRTATSVTARAATVAPTPTRTEPSQSVKPSVAAQATTAARVSDLPGGAPQQSVGSAQDGLVLLNVRVGKNDGFTRVVFDLAKADGSAAPVPQARLWRDGETVIVAFDGVREDAFARSLGAGVQQFNTGVVQSVYRISVRDDSATAYGIAVRGGGKATMSTATSPTRVIVDIADK